MNDELYFEIEPESEGFDNESTFDSELAEEGEFEFDEFESESEDEESEDEARFRGRRGPQSRFRGQAGRGTLRRRRPRFPRRGFPLVAGVGGFSTGSSAPCGCQGQSSEYVRWLQTALNDVMGGGLPVTGVVTASTRNAIRAFQQRQGLRVDGVAGPETKKALVMARSGGGAPSGIGAPEGSGGAPEPPGDGGAELEFDNELDNEFELDTEFEQDYENEYGPEGEFERQQDEELEAAPTGYPFRCTGTCPKSSTAECRKVYEQDRKRAISMALKAARLIASPNTKVGGTKAGEIYKQIFAHLPSRKVPWAANASSGSITIKRLQRAAKALRKGFFPISCGGPQCTADPSPNAWTITSGKSARIELCANYWGNTDPAIRSGILIHETLHAFFNVIGDVSTTARRVNAHCYEALVLLLNGKKPDTSDVTRCNDTGSLAPVKEMEFVWEAEEGSKPQAAGMQGAHASGPSAPVSFTVDGFDKGQTSLGPRQKAQLRRISGTLRRTLRKNRRVEITIR